ncbi:MAG: DUF4214 domain-containing protein [Pseudomonadota bacterium]
MKRIQLSELEGGDDHEFLVRLYTHVLDRWPDRDGYSHYLTRIEGKPEVRLSVIRDVARSAEARKLEIEVIFPDGEPPAEAPPPPPPPPVAAPAAAPPMPAMGRPPMPPGAQGFPATPFAAISAEIATLRAQVMRLEAEVAALRLARQ